MEPRKTLYNHAFDPLLIQTLKVFGDQLVRFWQQNRMQECREFSLLIKEPLVQTNKYLRLWGLGW